MFFRTQRARLPAALQGSGVRAVGRFPRGAGEGPGDVRGVEQDFVGQALLPSPSLNYFLPCLDFFFFFINIFS